MLITDVTFGNTSKRSTVNCLRGISLYLSLNTYLRSNNSDGEMIPWDEQERMECNGRNAVETL
jgi:hypothetical protein